MSRLITNNKTLRPVIIILVLMFFIGCKTVEEKPLPAGIKLTKSQIYQSWKRNPDKISYESNKYNADEIWIYKFPGGGTHVHYYFKDDNLITREIINYGNF